MNVEIEGRKCFLFYFNEIETTQQTAADISYTWRYSYLRENV